MLADGSMLIWDAGNADRPQNTQHLVGAKNWAHCDKKLLHESKMALGMMVKMGKHHGSGYKHAGSGRRVRSTTSMHHPGGVWEVIPASVRDRSHSGGRAMPAR